MPRLSILEFPDPRLRLRAEPVLRVDASVTQLTADMLATMYDANGIGLAATQVNVHKRIIVMDISEARNQPLVIINPELELSGTTVVNPEGCLSVPDNYEEVSRQEFVKLRALDAQGKRYELDAEGLLAVCIQHECDHLEGRLFVDYLSSLKRQRIRKKLVKRQRQSA